MELVKSIGDCWSYLQVSCTAAVDSEAGTVGVASELRGLLQFSESYAGCWSGRIVAEMV